MTITLDIARTRVRRLHEGAKGRRQRAAQRLADIAAGYAARTSVSNSALLRAELDVAARQVEVAAHAESVYAEALTAGYLVGGGDITTEHLTGWAEDHDLADECADAVRDAMVLDDAAWLESRRVLASSGVIL
ncbi:hypothetical protein MYK68_15810 [Gordonia sp. PP30]|uniref:hypothetical protein n=1 Tax=Gordonia sp. PP30 TaxID=2935861 RepID=UPI0020005691|nr:hypothetical protein [Gordonia sp. PP30]UQE74178.1 hypothetical protein MYK68_15810 [Gordonia sp. PP30]